MAEHSLKANYGLYNQALMKAINSHKMFLIDILKAMSPGALSQSDIDTLQAIITEQI